MDIEDFDLPDDVEKAMQEKHDEFINNQPQHEPNDGCDGGGCVI